MVISSPTQQLLVMVPIIVSKFYYKNHTDSWKDISAKQTMSKWTGVKISIENHRIIICLKMNLHLLSLFCALIDYISWTQHDHISNAWRCYLSTGVSQFWMEATWNLLFQRLCWHLEFSSSSSKTTWFPAKRRKGFDQFRPNFLEAPTDCVLGWRLASVIASKDAHLLNSLMNT